MAAIQTYNEDLEIAKAILRRDEKVTREFFYRKCYPLFMSIYRGYTTDCASCLEFINEIYILVMTPGKTTGHCQLENYRGDSTLMTWLKVIALYYCYSKHELTQRLPKIETIHMNSDDSDEDATDRINAKYGSIDIDFNSLNRKDALTILNQMPNKRYRKIIEIRYLEQKTNEETAEALGMTMDNYYNKHKLAKEQYERVWKKEAQHE